MGMSSTAEEWTAERVRALPDDGNRYELIGGRLVVTPSPRGVHQVAVAHLAAILRAEVARYTLHVLHSPADISLGEDEVLQPDLFVYSTASGRHLLDWSDIAELALVIEVISPSTAVYDRQLKRRRYQRARVPEYWIVDLDARLIERWQPDDSRPEIITGTLAWSPSPDSEPFRLDVERFFTQVWGE